jgi:large subunit ribosomal protein L29
MTGDEIREWDDTEVRAQLERLTEEQFRLRFQASMMQLENPSLLKHIRKDIARLKTILRERELAGKPENG